MIKKGRSNTDLYSTDTHTHTQSRGGECIENYNHMKRSKIELLLLIIHLN